MKTSLHDFQQMRKSGLQVAEGFAEDLQLMNGGAQIPRHWAEEPFLVCLHHPDTELCSPGSLGPHSTAFPSIFPPESYLDMVMRQAEDLLGHQQSL